ncbi:protein pns1 [Anaeramoeba flamelloides]|uniref:Choline transporter-like protein n=1 Tax=Anaeramoeba flamelloides TaxID=1746091 RepID=A0AAV7Z0H5_9EUKA|nr:protein pns1 [Anaeramoeba flamelloides]
MYLSVSSSGSESGNLLLNDSLKIEEPTTIYDDQINLIEPYYIDETNNKFSSSKWRDVWAAVFWILNLMLLALISIFVKNENNPDDTTSDKANFFEVRWDLKNVSAIMISAIILSFILSFVWLEAIKRFARTLIIITLFLNICSFLVSAIVMFYYGSIISGIGMLVMFFVSLFVSIFWRSRIPFSTAVLIEVVKILKQFKSMIIISLIGIVIQISWVLIWSVIVYRTSNLQSGLWSIYLLFSYYFTSSVINNIVHTTCAGSYACYYFNSDQLNGDPTWNSLRRASTYSFGSICLSSIIVAIIKTLRSLARTALKNENQVVKCIFNCILSFVEWLSEYFNAYALIHVAIYGKSLLKSSKATWTLLKERGIFALINDDLIGNVLLLASAVTGIVSGLFSAIWAHSVFEGQIWFGFLSVGFLIGFCLTLVIFEPIFAGSMTYFVCFADDPNALQQSNPELYKKFRETYSFTF